MGIRRILPILALSLVLTAIPAEAAFAAAPPTAPQTIKTENFDVAAPSGWTLLPFNPPADAPASAYWGTITGRARSGRGLWCAGRDAAGAERTLGLYPTNTRGTAELAVNLSDFYSSSLSFYYYLRPAQFVVPAIPDIGVADDFTAHVNSSATEGRTQALRQFSSAWQSVTIGLSNAGMANLSRASGSVWFQFMDRQEGPWSSPTTGEGVTIDDLSIKGYKYGRVVNPSVSRLPSGTPRIQWSKPYGAVGSTTPDDRDVAYRVWRTPNTKPYAWNEVTPGRITTTYFEDASAESGTAYRYFVQACDPTGADWYGEGDLDTDSVVVSSVGGTVVTAEPVQGAGRYETAVAASKKAFPQDGRGGTVIIAYGRNFPDALGGAALAGAYDAPLLLTETNALPTAIRDEIVRLGATKAVILGSSSVVSPAVAEQVRAALVGGKTIARVFGAGRYETAAAVATATPVAASQGTTRADVFLAVGDNFPDALAASPAAFNKRWPILLTRRDALPAATITALATLQPERVHILGSSGAVPTVVENELKSRFPSVQVDRWQGASRYGTAADIAAKSGLEWDGLAIATGENFPDALAGGVMQGKLGRVVLLTPTAALHADTAAALSAHRGKISTVRYLGSTSAVAQSVRDAVGALLQ